MRLSTLFCLATLAALPCAAQADELDQARAKCEEQVSANQETLSQLKALGQLLGSDKVDPALARVEGGCDELASRTDNSETVRETDSTLDKVNAASEALKGLSSVFGN